MDPITRLAVIFEKFPGIGPRQAGRFVQFLLRGSVAGRKDLAQAILNLSGAVHRCPSCMRHHADEKKLCSICADPARDQSLLAVVSSDADLTALENSHTFHGTYFVLGGTISLASDKTNGLREKELISSIHTRVAAGLKEVILAFPANPEGDFTALHVRGALALETSAKNARITTLGRGLSTGSELEYADPSTLKAALENRK